MSAVHRYKVMKMLSEDGNLISYDPHGPDVVLASTLDLVTAERDALQQRLTVADQEREYAAALVDVNRHMGDELRRRVSELERALGGMLFAFDDGVGRSWSAALLDFARKASPAAEFKPVAEGDSHDT